MKRYVEDMRGVKNYALNIISNKLNPSWILLDNQSTIHIFCNPTFLTNVRSADEELVLHTNAGIATITEIWDLAGIGEVWFHCEGIANILSFYGVQETNHFEIDYSSRPKADRETPQHVKRSFEPDGRGLYFLDCKG